MREIKFRAWHFRDKKMTGPFDFHDYAESYALFEEFDSSGLVYPEPREFKEGRAVLLQYTGLKDKNGKEIFEGDIVRVPGGYSGDYLVKEHNEVIAFGDEGWWPEMAFKGMPDHMWPKNVEVIGNIYENQELLTTEGK